MGNVVSTNPLPPVSAFAERRREKRVPVSLEVVWEGMSGRSESRVCDLSRGGCFIESFAEARPGTRLEFRLRLPTGSWLPLRGQVAYCDPAIGFGVFFDEISSTARIMLDELMKFYD